MTAERLFVACLLAAGVLLYLNWNSGPIQHAPGVLVPETPAQRDMDDIRFVKDGYTLTQRARFEIRARVLSRRDYAFDAGADLSPIDLALGWGPMSDQAILDQMDVNQSGRWFHLRWDLPPPLPEREAMRHSGNMHLIPANDAVLDQLEDVREGQVVWLWGYLVDARGSDGFTWNTSLSRDDTGGGSCELFYVERVLLETI